VPRCPSSLQRIELETASTTTDGLVGVMSAETETEPLAQMLVAETMTEPEPEVATAAAETSTAGLVDTQEVECQATVGAVDAACLAVETPVAVCDVACQWVEVRPQPRPDPCRFLAKQDDVPFQLKFVCFPRCPLTGQCWLLRSRSESLVSTSR